MKGFLSVNKSYKTDLSATFASHKVQPVTRVPMPEGLRVRFRPFGASKTVCRFLLFVTFCFTYLPLIYIINGKTLDRQTLSTTDM